MTTRYLLARSFPAPQFGVTLLSAGLVRASRPAARPLRILVVDDAEPLRRLLARALGMRGHLVALAGDGAHALERIEEAETRGEPYHLILSDLRMPRMGGVELLRHLRDHGSTMAGRVVFLTADTTGYTGANRALIEGTDVLLKPFNLTELNRFVEDAADARSA